VDVANDVERTMLEFAIVPERHALDDGTLNLVGRIPNENIAKPFALKLPYALTQLLTLIPDDMWTEIAISARFITVGAQPFRQV
jgi:hypothetical protein